MADEPKDTASDEKLEQAFEQLESETDSEPLAAPLERKTRAVNTETPKKSGGLGAGLAIFLALVAIGIAAYPAYEIFRASQAPQASQTTAVDLQTLRSELNAQLQSQIQAQKKNTDQQIQALSARLDSVAAAKVSDEGQLAGVKAFVEQEVSSMRARMGASAQDWIYAEVEYLIRMADQRVLMEGDAGAARQMLEAADHIIRQSEGLTAHGLRQALAKDIAALRAVATPDTQGIYLELAALAGQVNNLEQKLPTYQTTTVIPTVTTEPQTLTARFLSALNQAGTRLASLVDFRRDGIDIQPILPPREVYYLRQNLVLKIQLAQLALLEGNEVAYAQALTEAGAWVTNSFGEEHVGARAMQSALVRLSREKIAVELPDISASLREVRRHLAAVHHRESEQPVAEPSAVERVSVSSEPGAVSEENLEPVVADPMEAEMTETEQE